MLTKELRLEERSKSKSIHDDFFKRSDSEAFERIGTRGKTGGTGLRLGDELGNPKLTFFGVVVESCRAMRSASSLSYFLPDRGI